jgi:hypothetical protein
MNRPKNNKLNQLLKAWPHGGVMTSAHLAKQGYYKQLLKQYCDAGWVRKLGHGAYIKLEDPIKWPGAVAALVQQLAHPVHLGGLSALEFHGLSQYLTLGKIGTGSFSLFNTTGKKKPLPKWFVDTFRGCQYFQYYLFDKEDGLINASIEGIDVVLSSPERAILEVLSLVPHSFDYHHAYELTENLQLLNPNVMQNLLVLCRSVKVKRLFLYLADEHQLPYFSALDLNAIQLGEGKRVISPGGHYVARYQLSVPKIVEDEQGGMPHV